jgi:hypothetical protein
MDRGREEEATEYYMYCTVYLQFVHDIPPEETMEMTVDAITELLALPMKPLKYAGWNHTWGPAAFKNLREDSYIA